MGEIDATKGICRVSGGHCKKRKPAQADATLRETAKQPCSQAIKQSNSQRVMISCPTEAKTGKQSKKQPDVRFPHIGLFII